MAASTTHYLPFTRFTRQVLTDDMAVLATEAAALHAEDLLKAAPWMEAADTEGKSTFPARNALQTGFNALWDAFKFCGDYASGYQKAYAGMVAYRFKIPDAGLTGPTHITSIDLPIYVDRWLVDGVRVAAYLSNDAVPPADWTTCREGTVHAAAELPMEYTEADPPARIVVEKNKTLTVTFDANTDALEYLYVILSLEDYTTVRGFWIEGAALIVGDRALTTFAAAIEPDASTAWDGEVWCDGKFYYGNQFYDACLQVKREVQAANTLSGMAAFPLYGTPTEYNFAGDTGTVVGIATAGVGLNGVQGVILLRYVGCGTSSAFSKIRFSNAAFAPMSGKTFYLKMCIYAGSVNLDANAAVLSRPKASDTGYINPLLWQGAGAVSVLPQWGNPYEDQTPWALTKIGDVILGGQNYTDDSTFPIVLPAGGTRVILITIMPVVYWGTIGADTSITLKPGANIVLS